uniref:kunitz-type protease inhibitor 1-like isoform X3 n=1 Tax=Scatophagus argus TaxID=75038 RepID=UPI001ED850D4|nr:kunitz-type protease inhibitor 1-like isoform X3 [Scatophagus argus]
MPPPSSSSLFLPLLLLVLLHPLRTTGETEDAHCSETFRSAQENFVLDAEDAVKEGAALLATAHVRSAEDCERLCCDDPRCNLVLLEPRGTGAAAADNHTCVLFSCVHRNRFVCRFVNLAGYQSYIKESVFLKHLQGPQGADEQAPPIAIAGRDAVVQPGETVTLNGIQSLALGNAHITDYQWTLQSRADGVKMEKTELPDQVRLSNLEPGSYVFQLTVTDSNGRSHADTVTVLVLSPEMSSLFCRAPEKVGPCRAAFPRWRYDAATGDCKQFVFGGCKPNLNNFLSKGECLSACRGVTVSSERSLALPAAVNQTFTRLLNIDVNQRKAARCTEPPHTGPCRASHTRWYYDPMNRKCSRFTYGGCDANGNNFEKENKCSETCDGVTERNVFFRGMFDRFDKQEESDSSNIALAVLLTVAILALLAILAYCFLKSKKKHAHRPVATSPAHVALSEGDTLVYNSTTKPA